MPKSIAELRQSPHAGLPERTYPICVAGKLVAEVAALDEEFLAALDEDKVAPKRIGSKSKAKAIAEKADAIRDEMAAHTIALLLRAKPNGEWRQWCQKHPAREDNDRDRLFGVGICNSDDLIDNLGIYVVKIGGDEPKKGDWDFIAESASSGDLYGLARVVMGMHESAVDLPKSRLALLADRMSERDSE